MRYIIIGAGGIGGGIAGHLAAGGRDVTVIARGEHLRAIQQNGLIFYSSTIDEQCLKISAHAMEDDFAPGDVVFVCVKGYSLMESVPVIAKAARDGAVIIPILNSLKAGRELQKALSHLTVLDGCIYTSAFIDRPGVISQPAPFFRIVFGPRSGQSVDQELLEQIAAELRKCSIEVIVSSDIERDVFKKLTFVSAFAATDSYYDVTTGELQQPGQPREMYISLLKEITNIAVAQGLVMNNDWVETSRKILDNNDPAITSSMHKDILAGKSFEKQELIFDVVELASELGVAVPTYQKVAEHFGYRK